MERQKYFIYCDSKGAITARTVSKINESDEYIQGICEKTNKLRTFLKVRVLEFVEKSELESKLQLYLAQNNVEAPSIEAKKINRIKSNGNPEICFTGYVSSEKAELASLALKSGMIVRDSVTSNLTFLCCGLSAGPKKIEKARDKGLFIINSVQFKELIETGELPEE